MYNYWFVGQGLVNREWRDRNGHDWRAGRIEVTDVGGDRDYPCAELFIIYRPNNPDFEDFIDGLPLTEGILTEAEIVEMWGGDVEVWSPKP